MSQCKVNAHAEIPIGMLWSSNIKKYSSNVSGLMLTLQCVLSHVKLQTHAHMHKLLFPHMCKILTGNKFLLKCRIEQQGWFCMLRNQVYKAAVKCSHYLCKWYSTGWTSEKKCEATFSQTQYCMIMLDESEILVNWLCGWDVGL